MADNFDDQGLGAQEKTTTRGGVDSGGRSDEKGDAQGKKRVKDASNEAMRRVENATTATIQKIEALAEEAVAVATKRCRVVGPGESR